MASVLCVWAVSLLVLIKLRTTDLLSEKAFKSAIKNGDEVIDHPLRIEEFDEIRSTNQDDDILLPATIRPKEYFVRIDPILDGENVFEGFVSIQSEVLKKTDQIVIHMAELHYLNGLPKVSLLKPISTEELMVLKTEYDDVKQTRLFFLDRMLLPGDSFSISMNFVGTLAKNSFGLNSYFYLDKFGRNRRILATYFQPVGARKVFPCFDEPGLKARFTMKIGRKEDDMVLSNMPLEKTEVINSSRYVYDIFRKSVPMSTNVVAFVISNFARAKSTLPNGGDVTVWARNEVINDMYSIANLSSNAVSNYEELLQVPYSLPKLDIVALPSYPVTGMENFGLIITREASLLSNNLLDGEEWSSTVAVHEVAHQWIGNLVTPKWWSHYWLSEGFATYLTAVALEKLAPWLEPMNHLLSKEIPQTRLREDNGQAVSLVSKSHNPLKSPVGGIHTYFKGAAVLHMLRCVMGERNFNIGIRNFFNKFSFKTVNETDLCDALTEANPIMNKSSSNLPTTLHLITETWTHQDGYPLVTIRKQSDGSYEMSQEPYIFNEKFDPTTGEGNITNQWWIPINIMTSNPQENVPMLWIGPGQKSKINMDTRFNSAWLIANVNQSAYIRVNYDAATWWSIIRQLKEDHTVIPVLSRAQLIDDAMALFDAGYMDAGLAMGLLDYLHKEKDFFPWRALLDRLGPKIALIRGATEYPLLKKFVLSKVLPVFEHLDNEFPERNSHMNKKHRLVMLSWLCKFEHWKCVEPAKESFRIWKAQPSNFQIFPEFAIGEFLCSALQSGTTHDWIYAFGELLEMDDENFNSSLEKSTKSQRKFLLNALSCTTNESVASAYLKELLKPLNNLSLSDAYIIMNSMARSERWNLLTLIFFRENFDLLIDRFGTPPAPFIATKSDLQQFQILAQKLEETNPDLSKSMDIYLKDGAKHVKRNEAITLPILKWLKNYYKITTSTS